MIKKSIFIISVCTLVFSANADASLSLQTQNLSEALSKVEDQLSRKDRRDLRIILSDAKDILSTYTEVGESDSIPGRVQAQCIARDNDGAAPWIIGLRSEDSLKVERISNTNVGSKANCQKAVEKSVVIRNAVVLCGTRDNDGAAPYVLIAKKSGQPVVQLKSVGSSFNSCLSALKNSNKTRSSIVLCVSRDNDGAAPYIQALYSSKKHKVEYGAQSYNSINNCQENIK